MSSVRHLKGNYLVLTWTRAAILFLADLTCSILSCSPQLFQYEEMFSSALAGYSQAAILDPGWEEPLEREKQLLDYLERVTALIDNKVGDGHLQSVY